MSAEDDLPGPDLLVQFTVDTTPSEAFRVLARQLGDNLARSGIRLEPHSGGRLTDGEVEFGTVTRWEP
ncbi:MAG: hypothetical protein L3K13_02165, partial [Thermoplasmata archaeon]|nr:hypothetical protein [Thermoplasmata archaeon]